MSCYAATKHASDGRTGPSSTARKTSNKKKPKHNKYENAENELSLDKYNGKMMFSIWGLYNR